MPISPTSPIISDPLLGVESSTRLPTQTLDQSDFLKLLVAQLTSQDPLNPKADLDSIAQMAQFSALEQSQSMQADIELLRTQQQLLQANAMLGRMVEIQVNAETRTTGAIEAVHIVAGTPQIVVDGKAYDLSQVVTITSGK